MGPNTNKILVAGAIGLIFFIIANVVLFQDMQNLKQGDNEFYLYENGSAPIKIHTVREKFVIDFVYFSMMNDIYLGYIESDQNESYVQTYNFTIVNLEQSTYQSHMLAQCSTPCHFNGLSTTNETDPTFVTILSYEVANEMEYKILHFDMNGGVTRIIPILDETLYFNPGDIYFENQSYAIVAGKFSDNREFSDPSSTVVFLNSLGKVDTALFFGIDEVRSVAISPDDGSIYTLGFETKSIIIRNQSGASIDKISLNHYPSNFQIINSSSLVFQVYSDDELKGVSKYFLYPESEFVSVYLVHYEAIMVGILTYVAIGFFEQYKSRKKQIYS
ncbi:MAG: hypothetical protein ACW98K_08470 [Candidatus Kariarchaeaceae archaeon]|jgi:hypothetical protein